MVNTIYNLGMTGAEAKDLLTHSESSYYGTCDTAAATTVKVVTLSNAHSQNTFTLREGVTIHVRFKYSNTAQNPKLNVADTGAKSIYFNTGVLTISNVNKGGYTSSDGTYTRITTYIYDGTNWVWQSWGTDNDTTYSTMSTAELLTGTATSSRTMRADYLNPAIQAYATHYGTCTTAADTAIKEVTISDTNWKLRVGVLITVKFTNTNTATTTYLRVNSDDTTKGRIYNNTTVADSWAAGYANRHTTYMWDGSQWILVAKGTDDNSTAYLSYTCTSTTDTSKTNYLIGKQTVSSNTNNFYNSSIYFKASALYAGNVYASSDIRLKENIKPAEIDCSKVIQNLQIKEFNFKADKDKKVIVGAIAQQLQEILPEKYRAELVSGSEEEYYSINEGKLLYIVIGALKDEMQKTKSLEDRLAKLEKLLEK